jgi:LEA14-like dessication related protein
MRLIAVLTLVAALLTSPGCALFKGRDPLHVTVAGVEPLDSQGLELRMLVKLRVQNPNDTPVEFNGVALEMSVRGKSFASGVSDVGGTVPRFGETVISVPVTASAFSMLGQALGMLTGASGPITYEMKGKLYSSGSGSTSFHTQGELELPASGAGDHSG